jgi:HK97 family phage major capsid protein
MAEEVKTIGDVATLVASKMAEITSQMATLKTQVEASEKKVKDIFTLNETKEALKNQLEELLVIKDGEKSTKIGEFVLKMNEQILAVDSAIKSQAISGKNKVKSIYRQIEEALTSDVYKKSVAAKKLNPDTKMGAPYDFELKTITQSDIDTIGSGDIAFSLTAPLEPGVNKSPNNPTLFYDLCAKGTVSKEYIAWVERVTTTRGVASVAENGLIPSTTAVTWAEAKADVKKIADATVISNEMLEDVDYAMSEIMDLLQFNIPNLRDGQIFNGDGTSNTLTGITATGVAKTFAKPTGVDGMASPDQMDVLATAVLQCLLGNSESDTASIGYAPNAVVLNPVDLHNVKLLRDEEGRFKYPELWMGQPSVAGVPIRVSTRMTVGSFLVGDFTMAKYFTRRGMTIRMWDQNGTDPLYDRVTFTASERGVLRIKAFDKFAFVKGTFSAGKTALTTNP